MNDTIELVTPVVDEELDDLSADQLRIILHNHAVCIGQLVEIGQVLNDKVDQLTQVVTAYTMQYPLDIEALKAGDGSAIKPEAEPQQHTGQYL